MSFISDFVMHIYKEHHAELVIRDGAVFVSPDQAWGRLSDSEQEFFHNHPYALRAIVRDGRQPRLSDNDVTVTSPLNPVTKEARWVARQIAKGIAPWTDPAYCADWLAAFRSGVRDYEAWVATRQQDSKCPALTE